MSRCARMLVFGMSELALAGIVIAAATVRMPSPIRAGLSAVSRPVCTVIPAAVPSGEGPHPRHDFAEPGVADTEPELDHAVRDGFAVVRYRPDLPEADRELLRQFITAPERGAVVGGPNLDQASAVTVSTLGHVLTCPAVIMGEVASFVDSWLRQPHRHQNKLTR